jgi:hypothetical protein
LRLRRLTCDQFVRDLIQRHAQDVAEIGRCAKTSFSSRGVNDYAESEEVSEAVFLPISLKASPVEIELPNGGVVRLPLGIGQTALIAVIEAVGTL